MDAWSSTAPGGNSPREVGDLRASIPRPRREMADFDRRRRGAGLGRWRINPAAVKVRDRGFAQSSRGEQLRTRLEG